MGAITRTPVLIFQAFLLVEIFAPREGKEHGRWLYAGMFSVCTAVACYIEWSAFVGIGGLSVFLLARFFYKKIRGIPTDTFDLVFAFVMGLAACVGGILIVGHILAICDPKTTYFMLTERFLARSSRSPCLKVKKALAFNVQNI